MADDEHLDLIVFERRMAAVAAVRQVVNAIWALGRAQLPLVEAATAQASAWLDEVDVIVGRLAGVVTTPSIAPADGVDAGPGVLSILIGPERAWCGPLARTLLRQLPAQGDVALVGARLIEVARIDSVASDRVRFTLHGASSPDNAAEVASAIAVEVLRHLDTNGRGPGGGVRLLHPRADRPGAKGGLHAVWLVGGQRERQRTAPATLSPFDEVLRAAVVAATTGRLAVAVMEAMLVEVLARVAAAEQARRACDQRLELLTQGWRVARQEQITSELVEIVSGGEALRSP